MSISPENGPNHRLLFFTPPSVDLPHIEHVRGGAVEAGWTVSEFTDVGYAIEDLELGYGALFAHLKYTEESHAIIGEDLVMAAHELALPTAMLVGNDMEEQIHRPTLDIRHSDLLIETYKRRPRAKARMLAWLAELEDQKHD